MNATDKLFKKFKKSRLHIDKELYKKVTMITSKKETFFEKNLSERICKHKQLLKSFKPLIMPNKEVISNFNAIEDSNILPH